jgi:hypothetical protein
MKILALLVLALPASAGVIRSFPELSSLSPATPAPIDASTARAAAQNLTGYASLEQLLAVDRGLALASVDTLMKALAVPELAAEIEQNIPLNQRVLELSALADMHGQPELARVSRDFVTMTFVPGEDRPKFLERLQAAQEAPEAVFDGATRRDPSTTALVPAGDGPYRGKFIDQGGRLTLDHAIKLVKRKRTPEDQLSRALTELDNALSFQKKRGRILRDLRLGRSLQALFNEFPQTHPLGEKVRAVLMKARDAARAQKSSPKETLREGLSSAVWEAVERVPGGWGLIVAFVFAGLLVGALWVPAAVGDVFIGTARAVRGPRRRPELLEGAKHAVKALPPPGIEGK